MAFGGRCLVRASSSMKWMIALSDMTSARFVGTGRARIVVVPKHDAARTPGLAHSTP